MKKFLLLMLIAFSYCNYSYSQLALTNFNSAGLNGWTMINDANNPDPAVWNSAFIPLFKSSAFLKYNRGNGDSCLIAPAKFSPAVAPDRWLISPKFTVDGTNCFLLFDYLGNANHPSNSEEFDILVSTGGTNKSDFTYVNSLFGKDLAKTMALNLGNTYNGQSIRVAIQYKSSNGYMCFIDNIRTKVLSSNDLALISVSPEQGSPLAYGLINDQFIISGTIFNLGATKVSDFKVYYQEGNNTPVSEDISTGGFPVFTYGTYQFEFATKYKITSLGEHKLKVWVKIAGDTTFKNDTLYTTITGVSKKPKKKLVFEEGTGTWCGWCPRGAVFMDSMAEDKNRATTIAVHNNDPMVVGDYDLNIQKVPGVTGFPFVSVDRRYADDPSGIFDFYNEDKNMFGFAEIKRSVPTINGTIITTEITVRPATDLNGNYGVAFVISEDNVKGTTSKYAQSNYYSSTSNNRDLIYKGVNYKNLPNPVPANQMIYNHVARAILPSYDGEKLPSSMKPNRDYKVTVSGVLSTTWNAANLHYSVLLIDNTTGYVLNSINDTGLLTGVVDAGTNSDTFHQLVTNVKDTSKVENNKEVTGSISGIAVNDSMTWTIKSSKVVLPSNWKIATVCDPNTCHNYSNNITKSYRSGSNNSFVVDFVHNNTVGYGYCFISLWKALDSASSYKEYKFSLLTSSTGGTQSIISSVDDKVLYYFDNTIFVDRDYNKATLNIFDINGKLVVSNKINETTIDFSKFPKGIYIANIEKDGGILKTLKFDSSK